jgi:hypothetical protein
MLTLQNTVGKKLTRYTPSRNFSMIITCRMFEEIWKVNITQLKIREGKYEAISCFQETD